MDIGLSSQNLATNLIDLRRKRKLSQHALSLKARIPRSTIALLESGQSNPTMNVVLSVCAVLGVSVDELLATPRGEFRHIRAAQVPCLTSNNGDVRQFKLLPDAIFGVEIDRLELGPGARKRGIPHVDYTKEYLTCVTGSITLYVDGHEFQLKAGDVLAFPGDKAHSYFNHGNVNTICLSVVMPFAQGAKKLFSETPGGPGLKTPERLI